MGGWVVTADSQAMVGIPEVLTGSMVSHSVGYKYHRRLVIWRIISGLVRGGMTADAEIDSMYAIYGHQTSVTIVINRIRKQKNDGTLNPNLRI
jgi:hypothetical protein